MKRSLIIAIIIVIIVVIVGVSYYILTQKNKNNNPDLESLENVSLELDNALQTSQNLKSLLE